MDYQKIKEQLDSLLTVEELVKSRKERGLNADPEFCEYYLKCEKARLLYQLKFAEMENEQRKVFEKYKPELEKLNNDLHSIKSNKNES